MRSRVFQLVKEADAAIRRTKILVAQANVLLASNRKLIAEARLLTTRTQGRRNLVPDLRAEPR